MPLEPIDEKDMDMKAKFIEDPTVEKPVEVQATMPAPEVKEVITERVEGAMEKDAAYAKILSKTQVTPVVPVNVEEVKTDAEIASQEQNVEAKVSNLVNIAMQKGVVHAVKVAQHMNDNYMLDAFHDKMMLEDLHDALLAKGLIKNL